MHTKNAEFKAGLTLLVGIGVFLGFLFYASGAKSPWAEYRHLRLRFKQGFLAPTVGDPVVMNGVEVGRVETVSQATEERRGARLTLADRATLKLKDGEDGVAREIYVLAVVRMEPGQVVPRGTTAEISESLVGSRKLKLKPGLSVENIEDKDTVAEPIPTVAAGDFTDLQRSVQDLADKVTGLVEQGSGVLEEVTKALADVRGLIADLRAKVDQVDVAGIQGNVLEASKALRTTLEKASAQVDAIARKVDAAAGNVETLTGRGVEVVDATGKDVHELLASLKALVARLDGIVIDAQPKISATFDNVLAASASVTRLGEDLEAIGPRLNGILGDAGGDLSGVLKRLNEVGHNLADASEDVRAHPWKLLNKPDDKEIAFENLRNAASNFVRASGAVQQTIADLKALEARTDLGTDAQKRLLQAAFVRLQTDLAKYGDAESRFTGLLRTSGPAGPVQPPGR